MYLVVEEDKGKFGKQPGIIRSSTLIKQIVLVISFKHQHDSL